MHPSLHVFDNQKFLPKFSLRKSLFILNADKSLYNLLNGESRHKLYILFSLPSLLLLWIISLWHIFFFLIFISKVLAPWPRERRENKLQYFLLWHTYALFTWSGYSTKYLIYYNFTQKISQLLRGGCVSSFYHLQDVFARQRYFTR